MTNYTSYSDREKLEVLYNKSSQQEIKEPKLSSLANRFWQHLVTAITQAQEPHIWQSKDRYGMMWWHGYDPVTKRAVCRASEAEMRSWLEERYYQ